MQVFLSVFLIAVIACGGQTAASVALGEANALAMPSGHRLQDCGNERFAALLCNQNNCDGCNIADDDEASCDTLDKSVCDALNTCCNGFCKSEFKAYFSCARPECGEFECIDCENGCDLCFSATSMAQVLNRGPVEMKNLQVGDQVLTKLPSSATAKHEAIYSIDHFHPTDTTSFVQVHTMLSDDASGSGPLELTPSHMVFLEGQASPVSASELKVGDQVATVHGPQTVTKLSKVVKNGYYNVLTPSGTIVVNGLVASNYASDGHDSYLTTASGTKVMSLQSLIHFLMSPFRLGCTSPLAVSALCTVQNPEGGYLWYNEVLIFLSNQWKLFSNYNFTMAHWVGLSAVLLTVIVLNLAGAAMLFVLPMWVLRCLATSSGVAITKKKTT